MSNENDVLLEDLGGHRRSRGLKIDGYSSESSEEAGEEGGEVKEGDEEDDMFSTDGKKSPGEEDETAGSMGKKAGKNVKLMDMKEFEKELGSDDDGEYAEEDYATTSHPSEDVIQYYNNLENEDVEELDRRKIKEMNGPKMEAFNLKREAKEGVFDEFGSYIRRERKEEEDDEEDDEDDIDSDNVNTKDSWLNGVKVEEIEKAKEAEEVKREQRKLAIQEKRKNREAIKTWQLVAQLLEFLERTETPKELLQRLYGILKRYRRQRQIKRPRNGEKGYGTGSGGGGGDEREDETEAAVLEDQIKRLTDAIEQLVERRYQNIYDMSREELQREYTKLTGDEYTGKKKRKHEDEGEATEDEEGKSVDGDGDDSDLWEYRWNLITDDEENGGDQDQDQDQTIYGPFDSSTMDSWKQTYFALKTAYARRKGDSSGKFVDVSQIDFHS